jgi:hypothetical protein
MTTEETISRSEIEMRETEAHADDIPSEWAELHYAEGEYRTIDVVDDQKNNYTLVEGVYTHEPTGAMISIHPDPKTVMGEAPTHTVNYNVPIDGAYNEEMKARIGEIFNPIFDDATWVAASVVPEHDPISESHPVRNQSYDDRSVQTNIHTARQVDWEWYLDETPDGRIRRDAKQVFEKLENQVSDVDMWHVSSGVGYISENYEQLSTLREVVRQNTSYDVSPVEATLIVTDGDDGHTLSYEKGTPKDVSETVNLNTYLDLAKIDIESLSPGATIATVKLEIKLDMISHPMSQSMQAGYKITAIESTPIDAQIERGLVGRMTHKVTHWLDRS